MSMEHSTN